MNARLISTLIKKDLVLFTRDRFYFLITVVGLVLYIILYMVLPSTVDETLHLGIYAPGEPEINQAVLEEDGIAVMPFSTEEELQAAVNRNEFPAGIALEENFHQMLLDGERPQVTVYFSREAPEELQGAITTMIRQLASIGAGAEVLVDMQAEILGPDMIGEQIPWRDRMVPMLIILILGTEILSLASLVSTELQQNTVRALLVTPLKLGHLLSAKAILGVALAFLQVVLFAAIVGSLTREPGLLILVLLAGSLLVTGLGFLVASLSRDMMGVTSWGMIIVVIFFIPSVGVLVPGFISNWAGIIPSYHLTDAVNRITNYGAGFGDISGHLLVILAWSVAFAVTGTVLLRRRYR